jgi:hypothetical protein
MEEDVRPNPKTKRPVMFEESRPGTPRKLVGLVIVALLVALTFAIAARAAPVPNQVVYDNQLQNLWQDWSWAGHDLAQTAVVHSPPRAISWEADGWGGLFFHHSAQRFSNYTGLRFWHRGNGSQQVRLVVYANTSVEVGSLALTVPATWTQRVVTWAELGIDTTANPRFDGLVVADASGANQPTVYLDDVELLGANLPDPPPITVEVSPDLDRFPISPLIFGANWGDDVPSAAQLATGFYPATRWGGNATSRYNWLLDTSNRGFDYYFLNIATGAGGGAHADAFVNASRDAEAEVVMTVPIDRVASSRARTPGFSVAKYGPQQRTECFDSPGVPGCENNGNGLCYPAQNDKLCGGVRCCDPDGPQVPWQPDPNLRFIRANDPADTSIPVDLEVHVGDFVSHLVGEHGTAAGGGVRYYGLDNEPMLWDSTHRDMRGTPGSSVRPAPASYDEVWSKGIAAALEIKSRDASADVMGPDTWGWCDFWSSALDTADGFCLGGPDRAAHGDLPFPAWYMQQSCANRLPNGDLPIDWLDIHFYPQGQDSGGDGVAGTFGDQSVEGSEELIELRLRSLKELYDPEWPSESWIALGTPDVVSLIPRLREWRDQYCPDMKLALTEYKWGRDDTLSGALAQTEALAIFGRERLDMAMRWVAPASGSLSEHAYRLYRDYDGNGGKVEGDTVRAVSNDVDRVGGYAIRSAEDELFVVLVNKDPAAQPATITVAGGVTGPVALWRLSAAGYEAAGSIDSTATGFALSLPGRTATLARVQLAGGEGYPLVINTAGPGGGTIDGTANGVPCNGSCAGNHPEGTAIVLYASASPGSSFVGWSGDCTGTGNCNLTMDAEKTVTATFSDTNPGPHTLTVSVDGNGTVTAPQISCPGDCSETYPNSTVVDLVATPAPGWRFSWWSGACFGSGACSVTMNDDYLVIAAFEPQPTLLVDGFESGTLEAWQH